MEVIDSVCEICVNKCYRKGKVRGIMDADPDEEWCCFDSNNFGSEDGCYHFEQWEDDNEQ